MNIRFPNITAVTPAEQISQIKSYLHQLVEQLNWALSTLETGSSGASSTEPSFGDISADTFYELKSLIIKSTETLNAYYEKINNKLAGQYVSQDDFDEYKNELSQQFDGLSDIYVLLTDFNAYVQKVAEDFVGLDSKYASLTEFNTHKEEISQQFDGLEEQFASQEDLNAHKQETSDNFAGLDEKYVSKVDFDTYTQETTQTITTLQQNITELTQRIDAMQETGGD